MSRLRDAYKGIQALEQALTDAHRKMAVDPANGIKVLIHAGILGQGEHHNSDSSAPIMNAPVFNPGIGVGASGILRQAEDDEFSRDIAVLNSLPTAVSSRQQQQQQQQDEAAVTDSDREDQAWVELAIMHKKLADAHHDFLTLSLDPLIPASLHTLPVKYNIPARLWQTGFHLLLERMRYTWITNAPTSNHAFSASSRAPGASSQRDNKMSQKVLEYLTDFIYDAYSYYTNLLEEQVLSSYRTAWIEALGDLARYRMAVASHIAATEKSQDGFDQGYYGKNDVGGVSHPARIDDDDSHDNPADQPPFPSGASIGAEVAQSWNLEERETWRTTARDWYAMGLAEKPGEGRLHHHLALLCRDVPGDEGRGLYHFAKR